MNDLERKHQEEVWDALYAHNHPEDAPEDVELDELPCAECGQVPCVENLR